MTLPRDDEEEPPSRADGWELDDDPTDPAHPDYDLSTARPYTSYEPPARPWYSQRWLLIIVALAVIAGLVLPYLRNLI